MFIVDFIYNDAQKVVKTSKFNNEVAVINFSTENSITHEDFEIVRINKYEDGKLNSHELQIIKGRIQLVESSQGVE